MMTERKLTALAIALAAVCSCKEEVRQQEQPVPYVKEILSDRLSPEFRMLAGHRNANPSGDICIIGSERECLSLAELMVSMDGRDNIDGSFVDDGLPDFSGETIDCLIDSTSDSFGALLSERKEYLVRERAVRIALAAVDTLCHLSPYDIEGMGTKQSAKAIILANPHLAKFGRFDIDTLFKGTGCKCQVYTPLGVMMSEALSEERPLNIAIMCRPELSYPEAYLAFFHTKFDSVPYAAGSTCRVIAERPDSTGMLMKNFLDDYIASGDSLAIDIIMVDDINADITSLKNELASLISIMNEESMTYGKFISEEFCLLDSGSSICRRTYDLLRSMNLFTHNISKPQTVSYNAVQLMDDDNSLILIPGNHYVQN